jgi:hypothetical protein
MPMKLKSIGLEKIAVVTIVKEMLMKNSFSD